MKTITLADWKVSRYQKRLVKKVLRSGRLTYGPMTRELEEGFAAIHNRKQALFTGSGTAALKIALHALKEENGWKDGDEVIIPAVTFVATMNAVLMNNLKPVLVDVELDSINMNPDLIERAITKKTKCIIPVHLLGQIADMDSIMFIAKNHKLKVVEDSCETMFVKQKGRPVGSRGDIACFSTYVAHLMVTGVGGFILTDNKKLATTMRSMMFHGRDEAYLTIDDNKKTGKAFDDMVQKRFWFPRSGYSDRATEMEAALGLGDLIAWPNIIKKRQYNALYLINGLKGLPITFPIQYIDEHAFMFFPMLVEKRTELIKYLESKNINTRTMMPLTIQPVVHKEFGTRVEDKFPKAKIVNQKGLLIGCHQYLSKKDLDYIIKTIKEFYS